MMVGGVVDFPCPVSVTAFNAFHTDATCVLWHSRDTANFPLQFAPHMYFSNLLHTPNLTVTGSALLVGESLSCVVLPHMIIYYSLNASSITVAMHQ